MRMVKKLKNASAMRMGRLKANYGRATNNRSLQVKGRWQRITAASRQIGQQVKDSGKNIGGALK
jgi:uncharacterized protein YjbJ (UPF0337 family)